MVGAGFSRNADKKRQDVRDAPTWRDVSESIRRKLYPQFDHGNGQAGMNATSEAGDLLRLAHEYKAAFGRGDLHKLIKEQIRDDEFTPGEMHARLLRLPWCDVFTTNWDTLLERTRVSVVERAYKIVGNIEQIPNAARPRIVKLHGSVPDQFPLISTEEDYRTYPDKFAPFVNTVQQAMMESVFCLIGFSCDDPNFLQWSGWVRDNLGAAAPKVYLAGWLDLSQHQRRMLEDRKVVVIDLAHHPKGKQWPEHLRHRYATDWLLHTLECGRPYDVKDWPSRVIQHTQGIREYLQPVVAVASDEPKDEPHYKADDLPERVKYILGVWSHNRKMYPGWLATPSSMQQRLSSKTREWEQPILHALPNLEPVDRLNALHELIWRREILLEPISSELETTATEILEKIDCECRTINGCDDKQVNWTDVREAWRMIALALVTVARQRFEHDIFNKRIDALSPFRNDDQDVNHRIHHERCLWAIYSLDFNKLETSLKAWSVENCDPAWMMRKSALLFEMGKFDDAERLIKNTLATIREAPSDERSLSSPSREGWALWTASTPEEFIGIMHENRPAPFSRWAELTPLKCNAYIEIRHYFEAVKGREENRLHRSFDLGGGQSSRTIFSTAEYDEWIASHRAIRLAEIVGLPPFSRDVNVASDMLEIAAGKLSLHEHELASRLILRLPHKDLLINRVLSRQRVAAMPADSVTRLVTIYNGVIDYALQRIPDVSTPPHDMFWIKRMLVAMEVLSRLVIRLNPTEAEQIFNSALGWYGNSRIAQYPMNSTPILNVLKRSWQTLPEDRQVAHFIDLCSAPIAGMDGFTEFEQYMDTAEILSHDITSPPRTADNETRWLEAVNFLVRGLRGVTESRKRASARISWMASLGCLNNTEKSRVALALWGDDYTNHNNLPIDTSIDDWWFLILPEPTPGVAEKRFRVKWFNTESLTGVKQPNVDDILSQVGSAIHNLKLHGNKFTLSDTERSFLTTLVTKWSNTPAPSRSTDRDRLKFFWIGDQVGESIRRAITGIKSILLELQLAQPIAEQLFKKVENLNKSGNPAFGLTAGLIMALPGHADSIELSMREGLASADDFLAKDAAEGLWFWMWSATDFMPNKPKPPTDELVHEIGIIIAIRRWAVLGQALQIAKWVFSDGDPGHKAVIGKLVLQGLGSLAEELRYDGRSDKDYDVPLFRWGCTHLALAMMECGFFVNNPAVTHWIDNAENDPLPEVRHAKHPSSSLQDG